MQPGSSGKVNTETYQILSSLCIRLDEALEASALGTYEWQDVCDDIKVIYAE